LVLCFACSSNPSGGAASSLDGTWKVTMMPPELFSAAFADGEIVVSGGTATATFDYSDVGQSLFGGCTIKKHQNVTQIALQGGTGSGSITESLEYSGCGTAPLVNSPITFTLTQTTAKPATFTPYDGVWLLSVMGQTGNIVVADNQWTFSASGGSSQLIASGSVTNGVATATDMQSDFAAQRQ
jgi:hypothetical protein